MLACLYGASAAAFVGPVVADLEQAAARRRAELVPLTLEKVLARREPWDEVERLYVLPFDVPSALPDHLPAEAAALVRALFPRARIANSPAVHELCFDKLATTERLLGRGVPMPSTLVTSVPEEAVDFIHAHGHAILKEPRSCAGHGHFVVLCENGNVVGESRGRRYAIELRPGGSGRTLSHGVLEVSPPFLLQRLVTNVGRRGRLEPAQLLRAYIVDGQVVFWTERYRPRVQTPSDFVISIALGARYRFLPAVSGEAHKVAMRAAEVTGLSIGVVDLVREASGGASVLELDTDGPHMFIDRSFKRLPEFRSGFDFDDYIAEVLVSPDADVGVRRN
jgi:glutathione synthase/RimK-type ligase-like ATP-grasp enzyme